MGLLDSLSSAQLVEALVTCGSLVATLLARRTNRWLHTLLERERQEFESRLAKQQENEMRRHNLTLRTVCETYSSAERVTLESLLANEREDFSLESSQAPSGESPEWLTRKTTPPPRMSGTRKAQDWSDDDERTALLDPSVSKPRGSNPP